MREAAVTQPSGSYPGYANFTRLDDGSVRLTVRAAPTQVDGVNICGYQEHRGMLGRCYPGDATCNNYCNMAPERGPMADAPLPCSYARVGDAASLVLTSAEFEELRKAAADI